MSLRGLHIVPAVMAALTCTCSMAAGVLKLSGSELTLEPGQPARELYVENTGTTRLYLDIEQYLLTNPGDAPERLVPVTEVAQPSLLVSPSRLTLAPRQKYRMGLKVLAAPSQTQVWRVTFRPKDRILVDVEPGKEAQAPLFVRVGYGVVIYQRAASEK